MAERTRNITRNQKEKKLPKNQKKHSKKIHQIRLDFSGEVSFSEEEVMTILDKIGMILRDNQIPIKVIKRNKPYAIRLDRESEKEKRGTLVTSKQIQEILTQELKKYLSAKDKICYRENKEKLVMEIGI